MWKYLTDAKYNEFLSSFNLVNTTDIKKINKILYGISNNIDSNYTEIVIHKKRKGLRFLYEPSTILKNIQKRILKNVLEERKLSKYACAYKKDLNLLQNAIPHINKEIVLKLDIKNFFDNINFEKVYNACFNESLYPKKMGMLLTNLCTYNNKLPQGAPTSGYISNLVMRSFDEIIGKYCDIKNISYTRYSDDMTFSGTFNAKELINVVKIELEKIGFKLNNDKIKIITQKNRQQVTGIIVNKKLNIRSNYKRKIRQEIYYIKKYGIDNHLKRINITDKKAYLSNLLGRINYTYFITDNEEYKTYKDMVLSLLK